MRAGIFTTTLQEVKLLGQETKHFRILFKPGSHFEFKAGQFVNFMIDKPDAGKIIKKPYSIASPPQWQNTLDFVWKLVKGGQVTEYLWELKEGDTLTVQGPLGIFTLKDPPPSKIVFVSTGTGIAPFRAMMFDLLLKNTPCEIWNIFGNRYEEEILYREEFEKMAGEHKNLKNIFTVSRPKHWKGETGYVQQALKKHIPFSPETHIYICGLTAMINAVKETALEMGFSKDQIHFEKYD